RSDLYGLGAMLYRMLTARLPFEGGAPEAMSYRAMNEPMSPPSDVRPELPTALEHVVLTLLQTDPANRHSRADDAEAALAEASPQRAPSAAERARRTLARRWHHTTVGLRRIVRARIGVAALAGLGLVVTAAWFAAQRGWLPGVSTRIPTVAVLPLHLET